MCPTIDSVTQANHPEWRSNTARISIWSPEEQRSASTGLCPGLQGRSSFPDSPVPQPLHIPKLPLLQLQASLARPSGRIRGADWSHSKGTTSRPLIGLLSTAVKMDSEARPSGDSTPTEQLEKITDQPTDNGLNRAVSPAEFDRILRKIDIRVIPILAVFYLLSFLDRGLYHDLPSYSHVLTSWSRQHWERKHPRTVGNARSCWPTI
jgi:hypothetical protein